MGGLSFADHPLHSFMNMDMSHPRNDLRLSPADSTG
jgi:hypothetical protein